MEERDTRGNESFRPDPLWWPLRVANTAGRAGELALPHPLHSLQPADLLAEAMRRTGLTDLGRAWPDASFRTLAQALDHEADLTPIGRRSAHRQIVGDAATRLRVVDALHRQPEVLSRPIVRPILMINMPRCGSTLLQFLLARAPGIRSLWPWEIADPVTAGQGSEAAVAAAQRRTRLHYRVVDRLVPSYRDLHPVAADEPEECTPLLARSFVGLDLGAIYDIPSYVDHVLSSDLRPAYAELRAQVQLIQGDDADPGTWVLRTPAHLFATEAILDAFPDAVVVQLHREPLASLTSFCSLAATVRQANSRTVDPTRIGPRWMELWARGLESSLAARAGAPSTATFLDVDYRDLVRDPAGTVERIRREVDPGAEPVDPAIFQARVQAGQHGRHHYQPEWFGLDPAVVAHRYADYIDRFALHAA